MAEPFDPRSLHRHLSRRYGIDIEGFEEMDLGVVRVARSGGDDWVARIFPGSRPRRNVEGDAEALSWLEAVGYPAERLAADDPVSEWDGSHILLTRYVDAVPRAERREAVRDAGGLRALGEMLGRLHSLAEDSGAPRRPGGAWHHFAEGHPREEIAAVRTALQGGRGTDSVRRTDPAVFSELDHELALVDDGDGLPEAFTHPDFVMPNVVATSDPALVVVDWTGAGRGPRVWSLGFFLWAEGMKDVRRAALVAAGYRRHITLTGDELARLPGIVRARSITFAAWHLARSEQTPEQALRGIRETRARVDAIVQTAHEFLGPR